MIWHAPNVGDSCREIVPFAYLTVARHRKPQKTQDPVEGLQQVGMKYRIGLEDGNVGFGEKRSI